MGQEFTFKPAILSKAVTYVVDEAGVHRVGGWSLAWDKITGLRFNTFKAHGQKMQGFELLYADGMHVISVNTAEDPGQGARGTHAQVICAVVRELLRRQADLQVALGRGGWQGAAFFVIGLISMLGGAGILAAAAGGGVSPARLLEAAFPLGLLTLFGAALTWNYRPGRVLPRLTLGDFLKIAERL